MHPDFIEDPNDPVLDGIPTADELQAMFDMPAAEVDEDGPYIGLTLVYGSAITAIGMCDLASQWIVGDIVDDLDTVVYAAEEMLNDVIDCALSALYDMDLAPDLLPRLGVIAERLEQWTAQRNAESSDDDDEGEYADV